MRMILTLVGKLVNGFLQLFCTFFVPKQCRLVFWFFSQLHVLLVDPLYVCVCHSRSPHQ